MFYQISLTSSNGMANGQKSPYIQAFWDLRSCTSLCKDYSTYQILLCSLSLSTTKESKSKAPKRPLSFQLQISTRQTILLPTAVVMRHLGTKSLPLALPPPNREAMTLRPQNPKRDFHPLSTDQDPKQIHVSSQRGSGTRGPYTGSCAFLDF